MKRIHIPVLLCSLLVLTLTGCPNRTNPAAPDRPAQPPAAAFTLSLDVSDRALAQFTPDDAEPLQRYLASSAGWKLTRLGKVLVAIRREHADASTPDAGKLRMSADGFYFKHQPWRRYRALLRFGSDPLPVEPEWRAILTPAKAGGQEVSLKVQPATLPDHRSYLVLSTADPRTLEISLEIMEESMDQSREMTRQLLRETNSDLKKVLTGRSVLPLRGYLPGAVPRESVRTGKAELKLETAHYPGAYHVHGYVNPGERGYTFVRAFAGSGAPLAPAAVREQTLEYVGWSTQPQQQFFFNSRLRLDKGTPEPARLELWFQPDSGPERKLLEHRSQ